MRNAALLFPVLVTLLLLAPRSSAQAGFAQARAELFKGLRSSDPEERRLGVWALDGFDSPEAARTLIRFVLSRDDRAGVIETAVRLLDAMKDEGAVRVMVEEAGTGSPLKRARVLESLRRQTGAGVMDALLAAAYDDDVLIRTSALVALEGQPGARPDVALIDALKAAAWPVRSAAIAVLARRAPAAAAGPLIERLLPGAEEGRLVGDVARALSKIGQHGYGPSYLRWRAWHAEQNSGETTLPAPPEGTAMPAPRVELEDSESFASRVVFVLALNQAMGEKLSKPDRGLAPGDVTERGGAELERWNEVETKIELAQMWLAYAIRALPPDVTFDIVTYGASANAAFGDLVPATAVNKEKAVRRIESLSASGNANLWDGLRTVYTLLGKDPLDERNLLRGPEAVFFVSDGVVDIGEIPEPYAVTAEIARLNLYRQIRFHCFGVGDHDPRVLASLAGMLPGGTFTALP